MSQEPLPGFEAVLDAFKGAETWEELVADARKLAHTVSSFTVDDLRYSGPLDQRIKGAALAHLHRAGEIAPLEMTRTLKRTSHGRPIVRWALVET